jgi:hypothetical protein
VSLDEYRGLSYLVYAQELPLLTRVGGLQYRGTELGRQDLYTLDRQLNYLLIQGSHVDRIRFKYFLNPERIQYVIC